MLSSILRAYRRIFVGFYQSARKSNFPKENALFLLTLLSFTNICSIGLLIYRLPVFGAISDRSVSWALLLVFVAVWRANYSYLVGGRRFLIVTQEFETKADGQVEINKRFSLGYTALTCVLLMVPALTS